MSPTDSRVAKSNHSTGRLTSGERPAERPGELAASYSATGDAATGDAAPLDRVSAREDGLSDYLTLVLTTGVGPITLNSLLETFGTASAVLKASPGELAEVPGVGIALARRLRSSELA